MDLTILQASTPAYISLGSNQGDSQAVLQSAIERFSLDGKGDGLFCLGPYSSLYTTEPQLYADQPYFINQVARLDCMSHCSAYDLLAYLQELELELGRVRTQERYGPRVIDLDILLFGQELVNSATLTIPHERMYERAFVLVPLAEIAPELVLPNKQTIQQALAAVSHTVVDNLILQPPSDPL